MGHRTFVLRKDLRSLLVLAAVCLAWPAAVRAREPEVKGGRLTFALPDLEGNVVTSSDTRFENKVMYVTLWGTWCPPCRSEVPTLNDLQQRFKDEGLIVVGIAFERDTLAVDRRDRLRRFAEANKIEYLVLDGGATTDFSAALPMVDHVKGLPVEILIDRAGKVVASRNSYGYKKKWAAKIEQEIEKLLADEQ